MKVHIFVFKLLFILSVQCEARNCAFSGWQKRMVCDDEEPKVKLPSTATNKHPKQKIGGGGSRGGGRSGGGGKFAKTNFPHSTARIDPRFFPDPILLSKNYSTTNKNKNSKLAFLFLSQGILPLEPLWNKFFKSKYHHLFSIYIHPTPEFDCNEYFNETSVFYGKCLPRNMIIRTSLGSPSKVAATRNLISFSLQHDLMNQYFLLVSDSCIPLFTLPAMHAFLHQANATWLLHMSGNAKRKDPEMAMEVFTENEYQLGSHWFVLNRAHAFQASNDTDLWDKYRTYCEVSGRGELCTFLVAQQRATKKILDQIVGPHAGAENGRSKTRIANAMQRGRFMERIEFLDCYMQRYRNLPFADVAECGELVSQYNSLMLNISTSTAMEDGAIDQEEREGGGGGGDHALMLRRALLEEGGGGGEEGGGSMLKSLVASVQESVGVLVVNASSNHTNHQQSLKNQESYLLKDKFEESNDNNDLLFRMNYYSHNDKFVFHPPYELPLEKTAMEMGRIGQRIVNRKCYPKQNNLRYDDKGKERGPKCVPDVRFFPSVIAVYGSLQNKLADDIWKDVRPYKLTSSSRAHDAEQGVYASLPPSCIMQFSEGLQPVEFVSGDCITADILEELRRPKGSVQLFARKFRGGMLENLMNLTYLDDVDLSH